MVPPDVLEVAAALYHLRIPSRWLQLAGNSSPPGSWTLAAWLTDLQGRHSHIERVVTQVGETLFNNSFSNVGRTTANCVVLTDCIPIVQGSRSRARVLAWSVFQS
jgi:hypothetical protein